MPSTVEITLEPMAGLVRDHVLIDSVVGEAKEAIEAAMKSPDDGELVSSALEQLRDLAAFMEEDLAIHIAKEERALFPALRGLDEETTTVVEEMVEQHDQVRERHAALAAALERIDTGHDEVGAERAQLAAGLAEADGGELSPELLTALWETVRRLHWILEGHFGDEEDDLFAPAETLLTAEQLAGLTEEMAALERAGDISLH